MIVLKFFTKYNPPKSKGFVSKFPNRTFQHFKQECDINYIVKNYANNGVMPFEERRSQMVFGDFTNPALQDLAEAEHLISGAYDMFNDLPSDVRRRFDNDPVSLIEFVNDNANYNEAVKLGLITQKLSGFSLEKNSVENAPESAKIADS